MVHKTDSLGGYKPHSNNWWNAFWQDDDRHFGPPREQLVDLVRARSDMHSGPERFSVVDIGSGNGRYAIPFARLGLATTVIEQSAAACERIQRHAKQEGVTDQLTIIEGDILEIGSSNSVGSYDVVFSSGLLEEIPAHRQERAVRCMGSLAKTSGLLVLKYCLQIEGRGQTVAEGSVPPLFADGSWVVRKVETDPAVRDSIGTIDFENRLRTELIIAERK